MPEIVFANLSRSIQKQIDDLRPDLRTFTQRFAVVQESRGELAPKFMRAYNAIAAENDGFTFVEFVRIFDATVPTKAAGDDGYRVHRAYMAADYLRRLTRQRPRGRQGVRDSATDALARALATVIQIAANPEAVWTAVQAEFKFSERAMTGLKRRVTSTRPLFTLPTRPIKVGNVIHMAPAVVAEAQPEAPAQAPRARRGRPRKVAA